MREKIPGSAVNMEMPGLGNPVCLEGPFPEATASHRKTETSRRSAEKNEGGMAVSAVQRRAFFNTKTDIREN